MKTVTANKAKTNFGEFLDDAQREPVGIMRYERMIGVLVSARDYEAMRAYYADRLQKSLFDSAQNAEKSGLTALTLDALLVDES